MCDLEYADRMERKFQPPPDEQAEEENARKIHKFFLGELTPPNNLIIKQLKEEYSQ